MPNLAVPSCEQSCSETFYTVIDSVCSGGGMFIWHAEGNVHVSSLGVC